MLSIGLSLISVGINSFGGGNSAKDFGSMENLLLALFVLVVILVVKHGCKGFLGSVRDLCRHYCRLHCGNHHGFCSADHRS